MTSLISLLVATTTLFAQAPVRPQLYAVKNVRLEARADAPEVTLIVRDGRIEGTVDARTEIPSGARVIDGEGQLVLPAFIDVYTLAGCETPEPTAQRDQPDDPRSDVRIDMREANRKGVQPSFAAVDVLALEDKVREGYRERGFGALLSSPAGEVLAGTSVLATPRDAAARDVVVRSTVFDHAAFDARGKGYPSTLMGYHAQLRQFLLDARHHQDLERRRASGRAGPRPPYDPDLVAIRPALARERRVVCEAASAGDIERWIALADEFELDIAIAGGRDAWKLADVLAERGIPVFLTLEWGDEVVVPEEDESEDTGDTGDTEDTEGDEGDEDTENDAADAPEDWDYEEPLEVRRERRRLWEESRDCAVRLAQAGVEFGFGSGARSPKDLMRSVRELVEAGLDRDVAMRALTQGSAELLGVGDTLGRIELGYDASFAVWTAHPLEDDAHVALLFIEGQPYELDVEAKRALERPGKGVDASGVWLLEFESENAQPARAELEMDANGRVHGTIEYLDPGEAQGRIGNFEGRVSGATIKLEGKVMIGMFKTGVEVEGKIDGDEMTGEMVWKYSEGADTTKFTARREPESDRR